ncbi:MAG: 50S ribosomal protein L13 [Calditrichaeota bacterium]|nr:MAG: 50S ribosomal protein L13 [Calditrichota bacterium]
MKTFIPKVDDVQSGRKWYVVDATDKTLGRLASQIAHVIRGKNKPYFVPHLDTGDFVIVLNAEKIKITGNKVNQKVYQRHTQHPGGFREVSFKKLLAEKPERIIESAVYGMLPKNTLGKKLKKKLFVYSGTEHPHGAQTPQAMVV